MSSLQRRETDLAIGYFPDLKGGDVFQQRLFEHGFVCLVRDKHPDVSDVLTKSLFRSLRHAVIQTEGRSQEIVEIFLKAMGVTRREMLHSTHFLSIPMVVATTDLIVTVPAAVGEIFAQLANLRVLRPPYAMPRFDLKQHWHRCQQNDPGNQWLRRLVIELFADSPVGKQSVKVMGKLAGS